MDNGPFIWEVELGLIYDNLKSQLMDAADDCDRRGHPKNIGERFRDAADVCDTAGAKP